MFLKFYKTILFLPFINFLIWFLWAFAYFFIYPSPNKYNIKSDYLFKRFVVKAVVFWIMIVIFIWIPLIILANEFESLNNISETTKNLIILIVGYVFGILSGLYFIVDEIRLLDKNRKKKKEKQENKNPSSD